jgi:coenzyme PQQ synthesis protein D (PqqD)
MPDALASVDRYEFATPQCVADDFGGEIVAINLESGRYFSLRGLSYALWKDLLAGVSPKIIVSELAATDAGLADASAKFIADLAQHGLIRPSTASPTRQEPTSILVARRGAEPPAIEVFDDMIDLFEADPIHDVDEDAGWPVRRESAR